MTDDEYRELIEETAGINNQNAKLQADLLVKMESIFQKLDAWLDRELPVIPG